MNTNAIEKIRAAEANAETLEAEAKEKAKKLIEDAVEEAKNIVDSAKAQGEQLLRDAVSVAEEQAKKTGVESDKAIEAEINALQTATEKKLDAAVEEIKKKLVSH